MKDFQRLIARWFYWDDENIKYLHEKVLKKTTGIYQGFYDEYGQALRISNFAFISEKDIVRKNSISVFEKTIANDEKEFFKPIIEKEDCIEDNTEKISAKQWNNQKIIAYYYGNVLDLQTIRAG